MDNGEYGESQSADILSSPESAEAGEPVATEATTEAASEALAADSDSPPPPPDWEAESRKYQDLYLRALADMENFRRRVAKEKEELSRYATGSLLKSLVPVLDNLNLALNYVDESAPAVKSLAEGVRMTLKGFMDILAERGLKEVESGRGRPFDPNIHEALGQEPDPELPDLTISREVAKGYSLADRLIRPAKVMVVKNQITSFQ
jgi:molecular chaperone GrpE